MHEIVHKEKLDVKLKFMEEKTQKNNQQACTGKAILLLNKAGKRISQNTSDNDTVKDTVSIIFQETGLTTKLLGKLIGDIEGPVGKPTDINYSENVICIGDGIGIAPLYLITKALFNKGNNICSIIGARSANKIIFEHAMAKVSHQLLIATDDGSIGYKGFVTDLLKIKLELKPFDLVIAIGPMAMMEAVAEITRPKGIKTIVSLNPVMVDDSRIRGTCQISETGLVLFKCDEGLEFDAHQINWEVANNPAKMYLDEESISLESA